MLDEHQKRFVKVLSSMSHSHSNALRDFAEMTAVSLANSLQLKTDDWQTREKRYLEIVKPYSKEELSGFAEMFSCVVNSLSDKDGFNFHDVLGEMYMTDEIRGRSKWDSDIEFTPWPVALAMVEMTIGEPQVPECGFFTLSEPACGTCGLVIAAAAVLHKKQFNFQRKMHVTAVEIRAELAHMAYIQLSLLHIPAIVIHGDSLAMKTWSEWRTPAHDLGFWDHKLRKRNESLQKCNELVRLTEPPPTPVANKKGQFGFSFK